MDNYKREVENDFYNKTMEEVFDEESVVKRTIKNKYFFFEDIAFGNNLEIIIEEV